MLLTLLNSGRQGGVTPSGDSVWGGSWGACWGDCWGAQTVQPEAPVAPKETDAGGSMLNRRRRGGRWSTPGFAPVARPIEDDEALFILLL